MFTVSKLAYLLFKYFLYKMYVSITFVCCFLLSKTVNYMLHCTSSVKHGVET